MNIGLKKIFGERAIARCNSFDKRRSLQGRFVLSEGGAKPRLEEEQTAVGGSEGIDSAKLRFKKLVRCAVAQNSSRQGICPVGHVSDVFGRIFGHANSLGDESAQQLVVALIRALLP